MPFAPAVVERTMKVQEVLMQAISGQRTWLEVEDILGWQPRTMRRWRERYRLRGFDGLWDRRRQQPSPRCAPVAEVARITRLYREQYAGFNAAHFHEFAQRDHGVTLGYTFVKRLLQTAGLLPSAAHAAATRLREPRPCFGELLHIDGSPHAWLALRPTERQTLIPIIDDATKRVLYAQLVAAESTATVMAALWSVLVTHGLPQALYTDRASWAFYTPKAASPSPRTSSRRSGAPWPASASNISPPTRPRPAGAASASTARSRIASSMSSGWPISRRCPRPIATCTSASSPPTPPALPTPPPIRPRRSSLSARWISPTSSVTKRRARSPRTIRSRWRGCGCRSTSSRVAAPARDCACSCAATSTADTVSGLARAASGTTTPAGGACPPAPPGPHRFRPPSPYRSPCQPRPPRSWALYALAPARAPLPKRGVLALSRRHPHRFRPPSLYRSPCRPRPRRS